MLVVLLLLVFFIALLAFAAWMLFAMACARESGPLGKFLPALLRPTADPLAPYGDILARGKKWYASKKWEDIYITSHDGLRLHAVYLAHPAAKRVILGVHGYRSSAMGDFSGAMEDLYNAGCSLFLIDQRAHGKSEGKYITFGVLERLDVRDWAHELARLTNGALPVYIDGVSMGAASVLMAGETDMPSCVAGVIADCGYTTAREELMHVLVNMIHARLFPALPLVLFMAKHVGGFDLDSASSVRGAAAWKVPVLFAHGTADTFVPSRMSEESFKACTAPKDILLVDGAEHGLSYLVDPQGYKTKLKYLFRAAEGA